MAGSRGGVEGRAGRGVFTEVALLYFATSRLCSLCRFCRLLGLFRFFIDMSCVRAFRTTAPVTRIMSSVGVKAWTKEEPGFCFFVLFL